MGAEHEGHRLDRFLGARIPRLSRTRVQTIVAAGHVRRLHEGRPFASSSGRGAPSHGPSPASPSPDTDTGPAPSRALRSSDRVHRGEVITIVREPIVEPAVVRNYAVLHEDDAILVVDKPGGLPVHPSARYHLHTLTALMRERLGANHPWEMAHRLDRETSGILVFGRRGPIAAALKRAFAERQVHKVYTAVVRGALASTPQVIDLPIGPAQGSRIRIKMGIVPEEAGGQAAHTSIEPLEVFPFRGEPVTWVRAIPKTGRQHQIRVHLAALGYPVVGDKLYGVDEQWFLEVTDHGRPIAELEAHVGLHRHALHATQVSFVHPGTRKPVVFEAPWPADLSELAERATRSPSARGYPPPPTTP